MTKNTLIIKVIIVEAANKLAHNNYLAGKITLDQFKAIAEKQMKKLDEIEGLAILHGIE